MHLQNLKYRPPASLNRYNITGDIWVFLDRFNNNNFYARRTQIPAECQTVPEVYLACPDAVTFAPVPGVTPTINEGNVRYFPSPYTSNTLMASEMRTIVLTVATTTIWSTYEGVSQQPTIELSAAARSLLIDGTSLGCSDGGHQRECATLRGTLAQLDASLLGYTVRPPTDFFGSIRITVSAAYSATLCETSSRYSQTYTLTVLGVNDAPIVVPARTTETVKEDETSVWKLFSGTLVTDFDYSAAVNLERESLNSPAAAMATLSVSCGLGRITFANTEGWLGGGVSVTRIMRWTTGFVFEAATANSTNVPVNRAQYGVTGSHFNYNIAGAIPLGGVILGVPNDNLNRAGGSITVMPLVTGSFWLFAGQPAGDGHSYIETATGTSPGGGGARVNWYTHPRMTSVVVTPNSFSAVGTYFGVQRVLSGGASYVPPLDYSGTDTCTATVCDGGLGGGAAACGQAQVVVTVTPVNDAPYLNVAPSGGPLSPAHAVQLWVGKEEPLRGVAGQGFGFDNPTNAMATLSIVDVDATPSDAFDVKLVGQAGRALRFWYDAVGAGNPSVTITSPPVPAAQRVPLLQLRGTAAALNAALANVYVVWNSVAEYGNDAVTITVSDAPHRATFGDAKSTVTTIVVSRVTASTTPTVTPGYTLSRTPTRLTLTSTPPSSFTLTPTATLTRSPEPSPSITTSHTETVTPDETRTVPPTYSRSDSDSFTPVYITPIPTHTPSIYTATPTRRPTPSRTVSVTMTATYTPIRTVTRTPARTNTPTPAATVSPTLTDSPTPPETRTPTPSHTDSISSTTTPTFWTSLFILTTEPRVVPVPPVGGHWEEGIAAAVGGPQSLVHTLVTSQRTWFGIRLPTLTTDSKTIACNLSTPASANIRYGGNGQRFVVYYGLDVELYALLASTLIACGRPNTPNPSSTWGKVRVTLWVDSNTPAPPSMPYLFPEQVQTYDLGLVERSPILPIRAPGAVVPPSGTGAAPMYIHVKEGETVKLATYLKLDSAFFGVAPWADATYYMQLHYIDDGGCDGCGVVAFNPLQYVVEQSAPHPEADHDGKLLFVVVRPLMAQYHPVTLDSLRLLPPSTFAGSVRVRLVLYTAAQYNSILSSGGFPSSIATYQGGTPLFLDMVVTYDPINDAPYISLSTPNLFIDEDTSTVFNVNSFGDVDVDDDDAVITRLFTVTVSALGGDVSFLTGAGALSSTYTPGLLVASASMLPLRTAMLGGINFVPFANYFGPANVTVTVNDNGNIGTIRATGVPGALSATTSVTINVRSVNDPPLIQSAVREIAHAVGVGRTSGWPVTIIDVDILASALTTTVSVVGAMQHGEISVICNLVPSATCTPSGGSGQVTGGNRRWSRTVTFIANLTNTNRLLSSLLYRTSCLTCVGSTVIDRLRVVSNDYSDSSTFEIDVSLTTATESPTPTPIPTRTPTRTASRFTPSITPSTATNSVTPSMTPTRPPTYTMTLTPLYLDSRTRTHTITVTPTESDSVSYLNTDTRTLTRSVTLTPTGTLTRTLTHTGTDTPTPIPTATPIDTATPIPTPTPSPLPTDTLTPTASPTPTGCVDARASSQVPDSSVHVREGVIGTTAAEPWIAVRVGAEGPSNEVVCVHGATVVITDGNTYTTVEVALRSRSVLGMARARGANTTSLSAMGGGALGAGASDGDGDGDDGEDAMAWSVSLLRNGFVHLGMGVGNATDSLDSFTLGSVAPSDALGYGLVDVVSEGDVQAALAALSAATGGSRATVADASVTTRAGTAAATSPIPLVVDVKSARRIQRHPPVFDITLSINTLAGAGPFVAIASIFSKIPAKLVVPQIIAPSTFAPRAPSPSFRPSSPAFTAHAAAVAASVALAKLSGKTSISAPFLLSYVTPTPTVTPRLVPQWRFLVDAGASLAALLDALARVAGVSKSYFSVSVYEYDAPSPTLLPVAIVRTATRVPAVPVRHTVTHTRSHTRSHTRVPLPTSTPTPTPKRKVFRAVTLTLDPSAFASDAALNAAVAAITAALLGTSNTQGSLAATFGVTQRPGMSIFAFVALDPLPPPGVVPVSPPVRVVPVPRLPPPSTPPLPFAFSPSLLPLLGPSVLGPAAGPLIPKPEEQLVIVPPPDSDATGWWWALGVGVVVLVLTLVVVALAMVWCLSRRSARAKSAAGDGTDQVVLYKPDGVVAVVPHALASAAAGSKPVGSNSSRTSMGDYATAVGPKQQPQPVNGSVWGDEDDERYAAVGDDGTARRGSTSTMRSGTAMHLAWASSAAPPTAAVPLTDSATNVRIFGGATGGQRAQSLTRARTAGVPPPPSTTRRHSDASPKAFQFDDVTKPSAASRLPSEMPAAPYHARTPTPYNGSGTWGGQGGDAATSGGVLSVPATPVKQLQRPIDSSPSHPHSALNATVVARPPPGAAAPSPVIMSPSTPAGAVPEAAKAAMPFGANGASVATTGPLDGTRMAPSPGMAPSAWTAEGVDPSAVDVYAGELSDTESETSRAADAAAAKAAAAKAAAKAAARAEAAAAKAAAAKAAADKAAAEAAAKRAVKLSGSLIRPLAVRDAAAPSPSPAASQPGVRPTSVVAPTERSQTASTMPPESAPFSDEEDRILRTNSAGREIVTPPPATTTTTTTTSAAGPSKGVNSKPSQPVSLHGSLIGALIPKARGGTSAARKPLDTDRPSSRAWSVRSGSPPALYPDSPRSTSAPFASPMFLTKEKFAPYDPLPSQPADAALLGGAGPRPFSTPPAKGYYAATPRSSSRRRRGRHTPSAPDAPSDAWANYLEGGAQGQTEQQQQQPGGAGAQRTASAHSARSSESSYPDADYPEGVATHRW